MTYSIVYDAVKIKTTLFEKPAPIINLNELAAAICMGYQQAGLTPPEINIGMTVDEIRKKFLKEVENAEEVNPQLIAAIEEYPNEKAAIDETAKETYDFEDQY